MTPRVVVAPAPFKGALTAAAAARAMAAGLRLALPDADIARAPVADGGEGTLDALVAARGGRRRSVTVGDPLGRPVEAALGELPGGECVVELAQAAGLALLAPAERDPEAASTAGVGGMIRAALDLGARRLLVAVGGSATTDGGMGLARALGARFLDEAGRELAGTGADMARVARVDASALDPRLHGVRVRVACDVDAPLRGPRGAARVFGPQKGASPAAVERLDAGLARLAAALRAATGADVSDLPGAGAAGGAAGGMAALLGAELVPGAPLVLEAVGLRRHLAGASLCLTGEGRLDETSLAGKAPEAVAAACAGAGVPCVALCGQVALGPGAARRAGFAAALATARGPASVEEAMAGAEADLTAAAAAVGGIWGAALDHRGGSGPPGGG